MAMPHAPRADGILRRLRPGAVRRARLSRLAQDRGVRRGRRIGLPSCGGLRDHARPNRGPCRSRFRNPVLGGELLFTLWTSAAAALIAALLAAPSAGLLLGRAFPSRFLWFAIAAAMAVPAPLAGAGLSVLVGVPGLSFLGSGATAVIMASLTRFLPFAVLIQAVQLRRVDRALVEAARVFERRVLKSRLRIDARLRAPGLWAAAGIVFSLSAGELAATLVVVPPGRETLAVKIFNYLHYGAAESVAGLCLVLAAATLGFGLLSARSLGRAAGGRVPAGSDPGGARR